MKDRNGPLLAAVSGPIIELDSRERFLANKERELKAARERLEHAQSAWGRSRAKSAVEQAEKLVDYARRARDESKALVDKRVTPRSTS